MVDRSRLPVPLITFGTLALLGTLLRKTSADLAMVSVTLLLFVVVTTGVTSRALGVVTAAAAALTLNFFFLPPVGTLHIAGAENWTLFLLFILASLGTSGIVSFARREAQEASQKRSEIEAVYRLGVELFSAESRGEHFADIAINALAAVRAQTGALFVVRGDDVQCSAAVGTEITRVVEMRVRDVINKRQRVLLRRSEGTEAFIPLMHGSDVEAVLYAQGAIDPTVIESLATLLSLAFERERSHAMQLNLSALNESDRAKTSVLRAVAHDLSTPLTALRIQIETLQRLLPGSPVEALDTTRNVADEAHRLQRRIRNLLTMARIEAGRYKTLPEPTPVADLFKLTRDAVKASLGERPITVQIAAGCADAFVDPSLCLEILTNLIENAHAATEQGLPIELVGENGATAHTVNLLVRDRGTGLVDDRDSAVGDEHGFGLGLHIVEAFAEMSAGTLELRARDGGGTIATVTFPAATVER